MENKSPKVSIYEMIIFALAWIGGFWPTFHYFLRARFFYGNASIFDLIFLGICGLIAAIVLIICQNRPAVTLILGSIILGVFAYVSLFIMPIQVTLNSTSWDVIVGNITTEVGNIPMCLMILGGFLTIGGMLQIAAYCRYSLLENEKRGWRWIWLIEIPFTISAIAYWGLLNIFPQNSNISLIVCCFASGILVFFIALGFSHFKSIWTFLEIKQINKKPIKKPIIYLFRSTGLILCWVSFTGLILLSTMLDFEFTSSISEVDLQWNFFLSCGIGGLILIPFLIINNKPESHLGLLPLIALILIFIYSTWIATYLNSNIVTNLLPFDPAMGTVITALIMTYFFTITRYSKGNGIGIRAMGSIGLPLFLDDHGLLCNDSSNA